MPVVAVIAAVAVDAVVLSAPLTAFTVAAAVGATLGAVGAVTRDKGLQTAGMIIGGIGAVGSLAAGAGLNIGSGFWGNGANAATAAGDAVSAVAEDANLPVGAMSPEGFPAGLPAGAMNPEGFPASGFLNPAPVTSSALPDVTPQSVQSGSAAGNLAAAPLAKVSAPNLSIATPAIPAGPTETLAESGIQVPAGSQGGFMNWVQKNPLAAYGMLQAGSGLVEGLFNPITPAQVNVANAQAEAYRAQTKLLQQQAANLAAPMPVATTIPQAVRQNVTGAPAPIQPRTAAGIINANVTGSIA